MMEIRTLISANVVLILAYTVPLWILAHTQPGLRGARWMSRAYVLLALGAWLSALRSHLPDLLAVVTGTFLITLGVTFMHAAMEDFSGRKPALRVADAVVLAGVLILLPWFTFVERSLALRTVVFSTALGMELLLAAVALVPAARRHRDLSIRAMMVLLLLGATVSLVRIASVLLGDPFPDSLLHAPRQAPFVLAYMLFTAAIAFSFIWMSMARLRRDLEAQARTDALTGLLNRRALAELVEREIARSQRAGAPLSLIVIDLDHFKHINDTWGHSAGDQVLQAVAAALGDSVRRSDSVARYGGEEFLVVLPDTSEADAHALAERLRAAVAALAVAAPESAIPVTASLGVVTLAPGSPGENWSTLLRRGDRALYRAKEAGRNRVATAT